jgi:hypothetical protein
MATKVLSDLGRVRSEKEWQSAVLFAAGAVTKATYPATTYTTAVEIGEWDKLQICLDIDSSATDAGDTLDVTVQMSMDNIAWYSVGSFTQQAGNGAANQQMMHFAAPFGRPTNVDIILVGSTACASGVVREHLYGRYIRLGIAVADNDTNGTHTISCYASMLRNDKVRNADKEIKEIELFPLLARTDALDEPVALTHWEIGDSWEWIQLVLSITVKATDVGDLCDVFVDISPDNENWINVVYFTRMLGNGTDAEVEVATLVPGLPNNIDAILAVTANATATVVRPGVFGAFLRARNLVTASGTDDESFTFSLKAYVK